MAYAPEKILFADTRVFYLFEHFFQENKGGSYILDTHRKNIWALGDRSRGGFPSGSESGRHFAFTDGPSRGKNVALLVCSFIHNKRGELCVLKREAGVFG